jgi:hypothetical protein
MKTAEVENGMEMSQTHQMRCCMQMLALGSRSIRACALFLMLCHIWQPRDLPMQLFFARIALVRQR